MTVRVQQEDFDPGLEISRLTEGHTNIGGVVSFVGLVRDMAGGQPVHEMTLEHYPGMTERQLESIEAEASRRWNLDGCLIVHRFGRLLPGDRIVLVITTSAHRADAFSAAEFLMDWLKTKAPFWKSEVTPKGSQWVDAKASDDEAAARWVEEAQ